MPMRGILGEVFQLQGRGVIVCLENYEGTTKLGEILVVGSGRWRIAGVEMGTGRRQHEQMKAGLPPTVGILLADATKEEMLALSGQPFETRSTE